MSQKRVLPSIRLRSQVGYHEMSGLHGFTMQGMLAEDGIYSRLQKTIPSARPKCPSRVSGIVVQKQARSATLDLDRISCFTAISCSILRPGLSFILAGFVRSVFASSRKHVLKPNILLASRSLLPSNNQKAQDSGSSFNAWV